MPVISLSSNASPDTAQPVKADALVIGLARKADGTLVIESGATRGKESALLASLADLGATGRADEVIKIPGTTTKLLV